jgi:asparagine synthetase B (glutamine-hydrolysing)
VKAFTIGFHEKGYNEAECAHAVAAHLGTEHTELYVTSDEAVAVIPRPLELYHELFADSSQILTFLVAQLADYHRGSGLALKHFQGFCYGTAITHRTGWRSLPPRRLR